MISDEVVKLVLDLANSSKDVAALVANLEQLKTATKAAAETYEVLDRTVGAYAISEERATTAMDKAVAAAVERTRQQKIYNQFLDEHNALQKKAVEPIAAAGKAAQETGSKMAGGAQGLLQFSRGIQDFQAAGFMGAVNNLELMARSLGLGAGIAGAVTILGTAFLVAQPKIKEFMDSLNPDQTKSQADAMAELADKTKLTAEETEKLVKWKKEQAEAQKILEALTPEKKETEDLVKAFLQGGQGKEIQAGLAAVMATTGRGAQMSPEEVRRTSDAFVEEQVRNMGKATQMNVQLMEKERQRAMEAQQAAKDTAQERINKKNLEDAMRLMVRGETDVGARQTMRALAKLRPQLLPPQFEERLGALEPEVYKATGPPAIAARKQVDKMIEQAEKRQEAEMKQRAEQGAQAANDAEEARNKRANELKQNIAQGRRIANQVEEGRQKAIDERRGAARFAPPGEHIPLIPPDATADKIREILLDSQMKLEANADRDRQFFGRLNRVNRRIESSTMNPNGPW